MATSKNPYTEFLKRWYWLLALGLVIAVGATYYALSQREVLYQATSTVQIGSTIEEKNPNEDDLMISERLMPVYAELAKRDPMLEEVQATLNLPMGPEDIRSRMLVTQVSQTQLIDIHVVDTNPDRAAAIANEVARQLVLQSPDTVPQDDTQEFIQKQLVDLQEKIAATQVDVDELEQQIAGMTSASDIFEAEEELDVKQTQIDTWQATYSNLIAAAEPSNTNSIRIVSEALAPSAPIASPLALYYGLAAVIGIGLATLLGLGLGIINGVIQEPDDLAELAGVVPLVTIPRYRVPKDGMPIADIDPSSDATASYRVLRNTLRAGWLDRSNATIAITSSRIGEGKTTTAANLGLTLANSGLNVILVDANLRNPELDHLFGLFAPVGFSELLLGQTSIGEAIQATSHPSLRVIGTGAVPTNYSDLLSSANLSPLIATLSTQADVVIFDTPSVLQEQETQLLAKHVTGLLLIAEAGRVHSKDVERSMRILQRAEGNVVSVVLNKIKTPRFRLDRIPITRDARIRARAERRRRQQSRPGALATDDLTQ